jgi:hypothetical protein
MTTVPVHIVARVDQHRAALRDLVHLASDHAQHGCDLSGGCAGRHVKHVLDRLDRNRVTALAFLAIAGLAELDRERPSEASRGLCRHREDAEDVAQSTLIKAVEHLDGLGMCEEDLAWATRASAPAAKFTLQWVRRALRSWLERFPP